MNAQGVEDFLLMDKHQDLFRVKGVGFETEVGADHNIYFVCLDGVALRMPVIGNEVQACGFCDALAFVVEDDV